MTTARLPQINRRKPTAANLRPDSARFAALMLIATALGGCGTPVSGTSGLTQGGQQCEVCRRENPGDNQACYAVCLPAIQDLSAGRGAARP